MNSNNGTEILSGKAYLKNIISSSHTSAEAKRILIGLMPCLQETSADCSSNHHLQLNNDLSRDADHILLNSDIILKDNIDDSNINTHLDKGLNGKTSVFATILRFIEDNHRRGEGTKFSSILGANSVMLSLNPREIPAELDTKDFVTNCLDFLSSSDALHGTIPRAVSCKGGKKRKVVVDAEKIDIAVDEFEARTVAASDEFDYGTKIAQEFFSYSYPILHCSQDDTGNLIYSLAYKESITDSQDFRLKILRLERAFLSSCDVSAMIGRGKRIPYVLDEKAERYLLMSGTTAPPRSASKKAVVKNSMTTVLSVKETSSAPLNAENGIEEVGAQSIGVSFNEK
eukprot:CAMPEP_0196816584 /NCGR_PEP_ID=MMETSP1362-20130617/56183_1 /TAXON_ID=163516 /ORGANISM="Leptocylindrus danicus, Strain CCMP1856" /LENGTH=341 /DNA_ID=CAMNT_0042193981 /DNA_START=174 /DNA_END=1196 /DNA_ORIENTATION=-